MVFYKIDFTLADRRPELSGRELTARLYEKSEELFHKAQGQGMVFTVTLKEKEGTLAAVYRSDDSAPRLLDWYCGAFPYPLESTHCEEVTFETFSALLSTAYFADYIRDSDVVLERFGLAPLAETSNLCFGEAMVNPDMTLDDCRQTAEEHLFVNTLVPELHRVLQGGNTKAVGHPVHYLLASDQPAPRREVYKALLAVLYRQNRLKNRRYAYVNFSERSRMPGAALEALYKANEGGAVVIRYLDEGEQEGEFAKRSADLIAAVCAIADQYKHTVLTVFCFPPTAQKVKQEFLLHWDNTAFVELQEDVAFDEAAQRYLKGKAAAHKMRVDKRLTARVEPGHGYTATELNRLYDRWHSEKMRNKLYPQYQAMTTAQTAVQEVAPRGGAYEKLEGLIGLDSAKSVMKQALNYYKAQRLFADRGMTTQRPSMHMVFSGNPGTAKTTVARLFAQIMKENGLLLNGELHEVGRADLVGKYLGTTAPLVQAAFRRAKGGVLFIDEAYSLVDDRDGLYGDEAINTIVQEMENHREDTVVIFAGYPDKMEQFLNKNPGLRSRIAFHIPFADYSAQELSAIAALIAEEKHLTLSQGARDKLAQTFEMARQRPDFGNGRFARNLLEKAMMAQANRLMAMDLATITDQDLATLTPEDIDLPDLPESAKKVVPLGFIA